MLIKETRNKNGIQVKICGLETEIESETRCTMRVLYISTFVVDLFLTLSNSLAFQSVTRLCYKV